jgi:hypothetical protein
MGECSQIGGGMPDELLIGLLEEIRDLQKQQIEQSKSLQRMYEEAADRAEQATAEYLKQGNVAVEAVQRDEKAAAQSKV